MILYFDENLPKHLAHGYHTLQHPENKKTGLNISVKFIPEEFGFSAKDAEWIPLIGKDKDCVVTQDINILRRQHELELYRQHGVGMFFLKGPSKKQGMNIWKMVEILAKHWPEVLDIMLNEKKPFAYEINVRGKLKKLP